MPSIMFHHLRAHIQRATQPMEILQVITPLSLLICNLSYFSFVAESGFKKFSHVRNHSVTQHIFYSKMEKKGRKKFTFERLKFFLFIGKLGLKKLESCERIFNFVTVEKLMR